MTLITRLILVDALKTFMLYNQLNLMCQSLQKEPFKLCHCLIQPVYHNVKATTSIRIAGWKSHLNLYLYKTVQNCTEPCMSTQVIVHVHQSACFGNQQSVCVHNQCRSDHLQQPPT